MKIRMIVYLTNNTILSTYGRFSGSTNRLLTVSTRRKLGQKMEKCFALRQLAQNQFQTDGISSINSTLTCMFYHTLYPILVYKNLSALVGFEPTSDTSRPKEGSRSMSSTTGEGRQTRHQVTFFRMKINTN